MANKSKFDERKKDSTMERSTEGKGTSSKTGNKKGMSNKDKKGNRGTDSRNNMDKRSNTLGQSAPTPQHLIDVASYSFRNALGTRIELKDAETPNWTMQTTSIPGIAALYFTPTYGYSADNTSGLNVAIKQAYAKVRAPKSGTAYFNAPDLFMVYGAVDSLYMYHSMMCRLYGLLNLYATQNRYYPEGIYTALNMDFRDLLKNMSLFRTYINQFALSISRFYLPSDIPVFARHSALCSGFFVDKPSEKAQAYIYTPTTLYMYDETTSQTGGFLKAVDITTGAFAIRNYNDIVTLGNMLLKKVIDSEEIGKIMADVQFAYSESEIIRPNLIDEFYIVTPMYNEGVLMDINNTIMVGAIDTATADITQDVDTLSVIYTPKTAITGFNPLLTRKLLNAQGDYTTPDYVMMMTRHMAGGRLDGNYTPGAISKVFLTAIGAEVVNRIRIIGVNWNASGEAQFAFKISLNSNAVQDGVDNAELYLMSQFDYHPILYVWSDGESGTDTIFESFMGDVDNYTTISNENLRMMHDVNLAYLLGIPTDNIGK